MEHDRGKAAQVLKEGEMIRHFSVFIFMSRPDQNQDQSIKGSSSIHRDGGTLLFLTHSPHSVSHNSDLRDTQVYTNCFLNMLGDEWNRSRL